MKEREKTLGSCAIRLPEKKKIALRCSELKRREKQRATEAKKAEKAAAKAAQPQQEKKKKDDAAAEEELDSNVSLSAAVLGAFLRRELT